jgi:hypothetical protein
MLRAMRRSAIVFLACLGVGTLVLACKKSEKAQQGPTTITAEPSASTNASAKPKSNADGPLKIVAVRDGAVSLGVFQDGNVFAASGISLAVARGDGELVRDAAWSKGIGVDAAAGGYAIDDVRCGGRFPDDAWLSETTSYGRGSSDWNVAHYEGGAWKSKPNKEGKLLWFYAGFGAWKDDKTLALRLYGIPDQGPDENEWLKLEKVLEKTTARFEIPGEKADPSLPTLAAGATPATFASLSSGVAVAVVNFGAVDKLQTKVQRWVDGDPKGIVEDLPGLSTALLNPVVAMGSASSAWVGGNDDGHAYLAHFDGKAWSKITGEMTGVVASLAEGSDGITWIITAPAQSDSEGSLGELWKRTKDGKLERVAVPKTKFEADAKPHLQLDVMGGTPVWKESEPDPEALKKTWFLAPRQVVVSKSGEPFVMAVVTEDEKSGPPAFFVMPVLRAVVLRLRGVATPLSLPDRATLVAEYEEQVSPPLPTAKTESCSHFFVSAGDVPDGAPADYDPKDLRTALSAIKAPGGDAAAYEVRVDGKRKVGIYVPLCSIDECRKELDDLVATLAKKLPSGKPTLHCRTPLAVRDLKVKFAP